MRVLVDSSAWIDFFNAHPSKEAKALEALIADDAAIATCGVIAAEVLQGIRARPSLTAVERHFREMEWLTPREPDTYLEAAALFRNLRARGVTIRSTIDCLVAFLAGEARVAVLHKDRDLGLILGSGLVNARVFPLG